MHLRDHSRPIEELDSIYISILEDLRSRYLVTYQSSSNRADGEFRSIRVEVARRGVEVQVRSGYTP